MSDSKVSLSLAGCGFLGIYHIGVASCLCEHVPHLLENARIAGASAGALIACCIICKVPMNHAVDFTLRLARSSREFPLGGWEPSVNIEGILRTSIDFVLPPNAHELCTNRLFVSVSCLPWCENKLISEFKTRQDLIDVLMCSAFVPAFSAYGIPKYKGEYLLDGGLSDNLPVFDQDTITISPWAGEHSICPRDPEGQSFPLTVLNMSISPTRYNLTRFKDAFYSPTQETLKNYCWQGYDDALHFLSENQLIHCNNHRVLTHLTHLERRVNSKSFDSCADCEHHRVHARNSQLSPDILAQWDTEEGEMPVSYRSLVLAPVKKLINIWLIPMSMIKDYVLQLFLVAYFRADKIQKGGLSEDILKLLNSLRNPKVLLYYLIVEATSKVIFSAIEYGVRVCSELFAMVGSLRFAKRVICREICLKCGHRVDMPPGVLKKVKEIEEDKAVDNVSAEISEPAHAESREEDVPFIVVEHSPNSLEQSPPAPLHPENPGVASRQEPEDVAVWLDIKAQSVEMAIPIQDDTGDKAETQTVSEMVRVEGVGEIEEVNVDRVAVNPVERGSGMPSDIRESDQSDPKVNRIHQYVHMFEQYKNVMTLHYMDENNVRHTESLFEEGVIPESGISEGAAANPSVTVGRAASSESMIGKESDSQSQKPGVVHDVERELKDLLEEKVLRPQREFEKMYQQVHQKRLKKMKLTEVRKDTGHFSLQVISFREDLPSPAMSRSNSIRNLSVDDSSLVRSVSDACSLASNIRDFRDRMFKRNERQATHSMSQGNLADSKLYTSVQSLTESSPTGLVRAKSDTSDIASSLRALRKLKSSTGDSSGQRKCSPDTATKSFMPRISTCPLLPSDSSASPLSSPSNSSFPAGNSPITPVLPAIPDVLTASSSSDSENEDMLSLSRTQQPSHEHQSHSSRAAASDCSTRSQGETNVHSHNIPHHVSSARQSQSSMSTSSHTRPLKGRNEKTQVCEAKREKPVLEGTPADHAILRDVEQAEFHKTATTKTQSTKKFHSSSKPNTPFSFYNIFRKSGHSRTSQATESMSSLAHEAELNATESTSSPQGGAGAQGRLVRSRAVHKSKAEMSRLQASLQELKSADSATQASSSGKDTAIVKPAKGGGKSLLTKGPSA